MARFWPIYVLFLVTFLVSTVDSAATVNTEASPKKTFLEKLNQFVSLVGRGFRSVASSFNTLYENFDLIGALRTDKLNSSVRAIEPFERLRKPVATKPQPEFTTSPPVVTTPAFEEWTMAECGDWTKYGSSLFSFCTCTEKCSFDRARYICRRKQAELAKCASTMHQNLFERSLKTSKYIFLGGNDRDEEGTWRWPDGSLLSANYTNWASRNPSGGKAYNCLTWYRPTMKWYDQLCDHLYDAESAGFVCEKRYL